MLLGLVFGYSHMISGAESTMSYGNDYRTAVFLSLSLAQLIVNLLHVYVLYIHSIDTRIQLNYFFFFDIYVRPRSCSCIFAGLPYSCENEFLNASDFSVETL